MLGEKLEGAKSLAQYGGKSSAIYFEDQEFDIGRCSINYEVRHQAKFPS